LKAYKKQVQLKNVNYREFHELKKLKKEQKKTNISVPTDPSSKVGSFWRRKHDYDEVPFDEEPNDASNDETGFTLYQHKKKQRKENKKANQLFRKQMNKTADQDTHSEKESKSGKEESMEPKENSEPKKSQSPPHSPPPQLRILKKDEPAKQKQPVEPNTVPSLTDKTNITSANTSSNNLATDPQKQTQVKSSAPVVQNAPVPEPTKTQDSMVQKTPATIIPDAIRTKSYTLGKTATTQKTSSHNTSKAKATCSSPEGPKRDKSDDNVFDVESILDFRMEKGKEQYLVKWLDYPIDQATWETTESFSEETLTLVQVYHNKNPKTQHKPTTSSFASKK
jgi:hypothetical protein